MALTDNLVSYWRLDETSGNRADSHASNTLTDNNTVTSETGVVGGSLNFLYDAASFVGATPEYLSHVDNSDLSVTDQDFTFSAWVKLSATTDNRIIISKFTSAANREYLIWFRNSTQRFEFTIYDSLFANVGTAVANSLGAPVAGRWYYIVCWHDSVANTVNIQVDNGAVDSVATTGVPFNGTSSFIVGPNSGLAGGGNSAIAQVGFWKRTLTTAERTQLWNNGLGLDYPFTDPLFSSLGTITATDGYALARINSTGAQERTLSQWTKGSTTYEALVYWNDDSTSHLVIGVRVSGGSWTFYTYNGGGLSNITLTASDHHYRATLGIDSDGYLHVCYNMWATALNYAKSNLPLDLWAGTLTTGLSMLGTNETATTYPTFFSDPSDTLYFMFRDGISSNGDLYFYEYDTSTTTWSAANGTGTGGKLLDGKVSTDGVYWSQPPVFDADFGSGGYMHLAWNWRDTAATSSIFNVNYVRWDGTNWEKSTGASQTIPATVANCEVAVTIASGSGLNAFPRIDSDSSGNPHIIYQREDGSSFIQIYHVWHNGSGWQTPVALTTSTLAFEAVGADFARPSLAINKSNDRAYVIFTGYGEAGGIYYYYSDNYTAWTKAEVTSVAVGRWATNYSRVKWEASNAMQMAIFPWNSERSDQQAIAILEFTMLAPTPTPSASGTPITYLPNTLYDILVYDTDGTLQMILQRWNRAEFHQRLNAPWNHQITLEFGYDDPDLPTVRNIAPDWIIEIYRTDPYTRIATKVYEGFNTTIVDQVRANGGIIINLYGVGYTHLLNRRIVLPDAGQEYSTKSGTAETVIKSYVNDCMVGAVDTNRIFPGVAILSNQSRGNLITYSARYTILASVCEAVSEQGNLDYGIYGGGDVGTFIFDARPVWGSDLREGNTEGNIPVIFSVERDNMYIPILSLNNSNEQNYMYVGGNGEGANRVIQEVFDEVASLVSPWSRKEAFVEAREQADTTALVATGNAELQSRKAGQTLSFNVNQTDSSRWIRDWNLGDLITAQYYTYSFDKQIAKIGVVVSSSGQQFETITVDFEDLKI